MYAANPKLAHEMKTVLHQGLGVANLNIIEDGLLWSRPRESFASALPKASATLRRKQAVS